MVASRSLVWLFQTCATSPSTCRLASRYRAASVGVERAGDDMLDPHEIGRRSKIEQKRNTIGGEIGLEALKGVGPGARPGHDPLLIVANRRDTVSASMKRRR